MINNLFGVVLFLLGAFTAFKFADFIFESIWFFIKQRSPNMDMIRMVQFIDEEVENKYKINVGFSIPVFPDDLKGKYPTHVQIKITKFMHLVEKYNVPYLYVVERESGRVLVKAVARGVDNFDIKLVDQSYK